MSHRNRWAPLSAAVAFAAVGTLLLSGCSGSAKPSAASGASGGSGSPSASAGASTSGGSATGSSKVVVSPTASTGVSPAKPITVTASAGAKVTAVSLTHGSKTVAGSLSADGSHWTSTGSLAYGTKYTLKVTSGGTTTTKTFSTLKPKKTMSAGLEANKLLGLKNGGTYGVGQIIMVYFPHPIPTSARAGIEKAMPVSVNGSDPGRWHWVDSQHVDYRGEKYWKTGTTLSIKANLVGVKLGNGYYGKSNRHATIHIGASHILIANNKTHRMKLYINGKLTKTIKVSMGMGGSTKGANGQSVNYWTRSGPHIVINKTPTTTMSSASYGVTDKHSRFYYAPETVKDTVRISYSGEFVHLRDWTVGDIGVRNSSHGCINVGIDYAPYLYHLLIPGDIVDVTGTPVKVGFANTQADWEVPWKDWN